jgi:hypothetical protein
MQDKLNKGIRFSMRDKKKEALTRKNHLLISAAGIKLNPEEKKARALANWAKLRNHIK